MNSQEFNTYAHAPMAEMTRYHQQIAEKYRQLKPISVNPDAEALMTFNGYYAMKHAAGAFFTVDTNMHMQHGSSTPIFDVSLIVSMDGASSERFEFTGTFDGVHLKQKSAAAEGFDIDLTFVRGDGSDGITASFTGTITLVAEAQVIVAGSTYNNPIPYSEYIGEYCEALPIHLHPGGKAEKAGVPVMRIEDHYQLYYDYGTNDGHLQLVPSYTYNMNMYFFSFSTTGQTVNLIMGTACAGGLVSNNIVVDNKTKKTTSRSIQTVLFPDVAPSKELPNIMSGELAAYSGYYRVPSIAQNAFVSIQAEYVVLLDGILKIHEVSIAVSLDGITAKGYSFIDGENMTFENDTLSMPEQEINVTFNRKYDPEHGSLVTMSGTVMGHVITDGYTLFNPVPLSGFGGATMTNADQHTLTVISDTEVKYNGVTMENILYVPIMYILANPWDKPTTVMSFGTDGKLGLACIVTDYSVKPPKISTLTAIQKSGASA